MIFETLLAGLIVTLILYIYLENFHSRRPPGPLRFPVIGTVVQQGVDKSVPPYETFRRFSKKYGPLCSIQLGMYPALIVDDFEITKRLLNHEVWVDRFWNDLFAERSFGKSLGIIFISGDTWKEMRRFTIKTLKDFGYGKTKSMESVLDDEVKGLLGKLEALRVDHKGQVPMKGLFNMPVLNVLWSMVCETRSAEDDKKLQELFELVDKLSRATPIAGGILIPFPYLRFFFPKLTGNTYVRECNYKLQEYFRTVLENRRIERNGRYRDEQRDYIDVFLNEIDNHKKLGDSEKNHYTDEQFIITTIDLFEAGAETTSNTLEFAFFYLMDNPEVQEKVYEEISRVVGKDRLPTIADKADMPYTEATLIEVQRMANVLPMTARSPTEEFELNGYTIPKGTVTFFNVYSLHMDEKFWKEPRKFNPGRFIDSNGKLNLAVAQRVIPFGGGRRVCLGETLARATLFTYFTALVQMYKFEKDESVQTSNKRIELGFTLTPVPYHPKLIKRQ